MAQLPRYAPEILINAKSIDRALALSASALMGDPALGFAELAGRLDPQLIPFGLSTERLLKYRGYDNSEEQKARLVKAMQGHPGLRDEVLFVAAFKQWMKSFLEERMQAAAQGRDVDEASVQAQSASFLQALSPYLSGHERCIHFDGVSTHVDGAAKHAIDEARVMRPFMQLPDTIVKQPVIEAKPHKLWQMEAKRKYVGILYDRKLTLDALDPVLGKLGDYAMNAQGVQEILFEIYPKLDVYTYLSHDEAGKKHRNAGLQEQGNTQVQKDILHLMTNDAKPDKDVVRVAGLFSVYDHLFESVLQGRDTRAELMEFPVALSRLFPEQAPGKIEQEVDLLVAKARMFIRESNPEAGQGRKGR